MKRINSTRPRLLNLLLVPAVMLSGGLDATSSPSSTPQVSKMALGTAIKKTTKKLDPRMGVPVIESTINVPNEDLLDPDYRNDIDRLDLWDGWERPLIPSTGEFPFVAHISVRHQYSRQNCTGTLIAPKILLTAASCLHPGTDTDKLAHPRRVEALFGYAELRYARFGDEIKGSEIIVHPDYHINNGTYYNDVAVVRLLRAPGVKPVQLVSTYGPSDRSFWFPEEEATAVSWGRDGSFREQQLSIVDDAVAKRRNYYGSDFDESTMLAAGELESDDFFCRPQRGAPLLVSTPSGWKQTGVTTTSKPCEYAPGLYSRVGGLNINRWLKTIVHQTPHVGDVNGDGKDDIVTFTHGDARYADVYVALSNGGSFGASQLWHDWWSHRGAIPKLGDFDGDGKDDIFSFTSSGSIYVALSNGRSFRGGDYAIANVLEKDDIPEVGDVNGDGKDDIVAFAAGRSQDVRVILSLGDGFARPEVWSGNFQSSGETPMVADMDGDGFADILSFSQGARHNNVYLALSQGEGFAAPSQMNGYSAFVSPGQVPQSGDFDGDGVGDFVNFSRDGSGLVQVGLGHGDRVPLTLPWHRSFGDESGSYHSGDFDGDGKTDIVRFTQDIFGDAFVSLSTGSGFGPEARWHDWFATYAP